MVTTIMRRQGQEESEIARKMSNKSTFHLTSTWTLTIHSSLLKERMYLIKFRKTIKQLNIIKFVIQFAILIMTFLKLCSMR